MAKGWTYKGDRNGVVSLLSLPGVGDQVKEASRDIARDAATAAGDGFTTGEWTGFRWNLPAGFRWNVEKKSGRIGYVGTVIGSAPKPADRKRARQALTAARLGKAA